MRFRINLHAHSRFSDGGHTVAEMFHQYKELGHNVAVFTDHYYNMPSRPDISLDRAKIDEQRGVVAAMSRAFNMGGIVGIEISINRLEEVVVIGSSAIDEIMNLREKRHLAGGEGDINIEDLRRIREKHSCMINLCHPGRPDCWCEAGGHHVLDGFEYIHGGTLMFDRWMRSTDSPNRKVPLQLKGKIKLSNSDAHSKDTLHWCWNEIEQDVRTEDELLAYVDNGGLWTPVSAVRDNW